MVTFESIGPMLFAGSEYATVTSTGLYGSPLVSSNSRCVWLGPTLPGSTRTSTVPEAVPVLKATEMSVEPGCVARPFAPRPGTESTTTAVAASTMSATAVSAATDLRSLPSVASVPDTPSPGRGRPPTRAVRRPGLFIPGPRPGRPGRAGDGESDALADAEAG